MRAESQVPVVQRTYYEELFKLADLDRDGEIGVNDAAFFRKSMLPNEALSEIWLLSDVKNGKLDIEDFIVALKLISLAQLGAPISLDSIRAMPVVPPPRLQDVAPIQFDWVVSSKEKDGYVEIFNRNDEDADGFISGDQAKSLFSASGLPGKLLGHIWFLSDLNGDRKLDCQEFIIATFLIRSVLKGYELPNKLPESLLQSSKYISNAGILSPKVPDWLIPPAERIIYEDIFNKNQQNGKVTGLQAKVIFEKSGLPVADLKQIWDLSDYNQEQYLDRQKFVIAMFLISQRKKKKELPTSLPPVLLESSKANFQPTSPIAMDALERPKSGKYDFDLNEIVSNTTSLSSSTLALTAPNENELQLAVQQPSTPTQQHTAPQQQQSMISPPSQQQQQQPPQLHHQNSQLSFGSPATNNQFQMMGNSTQQSPTQSFGQVHTKESIEKVRQQTMEKEKSLADLQKQFMEESAMSIELNRQLQADTKALDDVMLEIKEHEEKLAAQKQINTEIKENILSTRVDIKSCKAQLEQVAKLLKEKSEQFEDENESLSLLQTDLDEKKAELDKYNQEIATIKASIEALKSQKPEKKSEIQQSNKQISDAKAEVKRLNEEFKQVKAQTAINQSTDSLRDSSASITSPKPVQSTFDDGWSLFNTTNVVTATPPVESPSKPQPIISPVATLNAAASPVATLNAVASIPSPTTTTTTTTTTTSTGTTAATPPLTTGATVFSPSNDSSNFFSADNFFDDKFNGFGDSSQSFTSSQFSNNLFSVVGEDTSSASHKAEAGSDNLSSDAGSKPFAESSGFDTFDSFQSATDPFNFDVVNTSFSDRDTFIMPRSSTPISSFGGSVGSLPSTTTTTSTENNSKPVEFTNNMFDDLSNSKSADSNSKPVEFSHSAFDDADNKVVGFDDSFDDGFSTDSTIKVETGSTPFNTPANSINADELFGSTPFGLATSKDNNSSTTSADHNLFFDNNASFSSNFNFGDSPFASN